MSGFRTALIVALSVALPAQAQLLRQSDQSSAEAPQPPSVNTDPSAAETVAATPITPASPAIIAQTRMGPPGTDEKNIAGVTLGTISNALPAAIGAQTLQMHSLMGGELLAIYGQDAAMKDASGITVTLFDPPSGQPLTSDDLSRDSFASARITAAQTGLAGFAQAIGQQPEARALTLADGSFAKCYSAPHDPGAVRDARIRVVTTCHAAVKGRLAEISQAVPLDGALNEAGMTAARASAYGDVVALMAALDG